jgi:hypothetical protein
MPPAAPLAANQSSQGFVLPKPQTRDQPVGTSAFDCGMLQMRSNDLREFMNVPDVGMI